VASFAGPPSGGHFDVSAVVQVIEEEIQAVEASWAHNPRISGAGRDAILEFANRFLSDLNDRALPPGIDTASLTRQVVGLTREFLQMVHLQAQAAGSFQLAPDGTRELPPSLISSNLPDFVGARCLCWPQ
jgi:hypothetical protein